MTRRQMTVDEILAEAGISTTDKGPFVSALRSKLAESIASGMRAKHWDWGPKAFDMTAEQRAKYILQVDWAIERGHSQLVRAMDGHRLWRYSAEKQRLVFRPNTLNWLADKVGYFGMKYRTWRDKGRNPYL